MPRLLLTTLALTLLATNAPARQVPHGQDRPPNEPLSPGEAVERMKVPAGFAVEVVASEPDLVNPVAMTIDERGRFWVTESLEYPRKPAGKGRDRIKVLEDTDGDGKADKFTVFADGLNIPSGIAVGYGGVWVANSPDILFLKDLDGDGKADAREVIVTGFGRDDTHELPNSLTWGPDGWLYGWNGVFNQSHVEYRGKKHDFTCAIFRIHPRTRDFEVFCEGTSNPWGIAIDPEGSFFASACVIDHLWHLVETGYYHRQGGPYPPFTWKLDSIVDHRHQKAAYCGIHYFDSPAYPPEYRGRLYMGNIHGNCINVDTLKRNGSTYVADDAPDFLNADDAWFMPVAQKTGPDGCLYILDWYDRYHCYQDANRDPAGIDRLKGRLYRVRYKDTPRAKPRDLAKADDEELTRLLSSPNVYDRDIAQRLLVERANFRLIHRLQNLVLDPKADRKGRMHALWAVVSSGPLEVEFHQRLLNHEDTTLRAWGVRAAGNMHEVDVSIRHKVESLAHDPSADVRLQVAIAARKIRKIEPISLLVEILDASGDDPILPAIVWQNLNPLLDGYAGRFVRLLDRDDVKISAGMALVLPRALERILSRQEFRPGLVATLLARLIERKDPATIRPALAAIAARIRSIPRNRLDAMNAEVVTTIGKVLREAVAVDREGPLADDYQVMLAYGGFETGLIRAGDIFRNGLAREETRLVALDAIVWGLPPDRVANIVKPVLADREVPGSTTFRAQILAALGRLDGPQVAEVVLAAYPHFEPGLKARAIELLTQRPSWALALLDAVSKKSISPDALNVNQLRRLLQLKDEGIQKQVKSTWGTIREGRNPNREQVIGRMRDHLRNTPGDPLKGRPVFDKLCGQCHKIYGQGQEVGPDLTGVGRASLDQLLSNVFDPNLVIGSAYQATTVATADGRVLTGLLAEDNDRRVVLRLQGGKLETIPRDQVDEKKVGAVSLMPEDIEKQLTDREWADLFAFLCLDKAPDDPNASPIPGAEVLPGFRKKRN
jgi:putative membrane-bound dehydrogenase-like protein